MQNWMFPLPRETFDAIIYRFLALHKIVIIVLAVVPFAAPLLDA